ncbi:heme/hemin ABC transporter substrate-binding protein [Cerasicoccus maritimus]|uniref:heme/hemin ABC transporter substrate-binding protein n=1 Tax=Cerasicoccus maritimus TaxID=490089 RepID=UPI002852BF85|nr:ABC transporter substrate-binding protein [Cerasicoccus maritimus]
MLAHVNRKNQVFEIMSHFHQWIFLKSLLLVITLAPVVLLADAKPRIVTVGGAATEIVFALGGGDDVVAVDLSSTYPAKVRDLPQVGYIRNITPEGILSMRPDLIVATETLGPPAAKKMLKQMGAPMVWIPEPKSLAALENGLRTIGKKLGKSAKAEEIILEVRAKLAESADTAKQWSNKPTAVFFLAPPSSSGGGRAGGKDTRGAELIELAGGESVVDFSNFQVMSIESLIKTDPDVIFVGVSDGHGATPESVEAMRQLPGLAGIKAVKNNAIYAVPLDDLSFGPRLGDAVQRWNAHLAEVAK